MSGRAAPEGTDERIEHLIALVEQAVAPGGINAVRTEVAKLRKELLEEIAAARQHGTDVETRLQRALIGEHGTNGLNGRITKLEEVSRLGFENTIWDELVALKGRFETHLVAGEAGLTAGMAVGKAGLAIASTVGGVVGATLATLVGFVLTSLVG